MTTIPVTVSLAAQGHGCGRVRSVVKSVAEAVCPCVWCGRMHVDHDRCTDWSPKLGPAIHTWWSRQYLTREYVFGDSP